MTFQWDLDLTQVPNTLLEPTSWLMYNPPLSFYLLSLTSPCTCKPHTFFFYLSYLFPFGLDSLFLEHSSAASLTSGLDYRCVFNPVLLYQGPTTVQPPVSLPRLACPG